jgi:hypothetical protein
MYYAPRSERGIEAAGASRAATAQARIGTSSHHAGVAVIAAKVVLAPGFVVGASLIARRFGARIGGFVGALPVVAGPILLVYALAHGRAFGADAAAGTLLGLVSLTAFVAVYSHLAGRTTWSISLLAGWVAFLLTTALMSTLSLPSPGALALASAAIACALVILPRAAPDRRPRAQPPSWDLPLRALSALALVLALTAAAGWLGPRLSGLLAPFPVIASVLATFTHAQRGSAYTQRLLRGLVAGFVAFALFCFTLAVSLRSLGIGSAFALATAVALLTQGFLVSLALRARSAVRTAQSHG